MSVSLTHAVSATVIETLSVPDAAEGNADIIHNQFNRSSTIYTASTAVPVTKVASFNKAMSAGAATIDLTALTGVTGTIDGTGLKVQMIRLLAPSTNTGAVTIKFGAANPYNLLGASWTLKLLPGQELTLFLNESAPDVASGAKNIDMSGTGTESLNMIIVLG